MSLSHLVIIHDYCSTYQAHTPSPEAMVVGIFASYLYLQVGIKVQFWYPSCHCSGQSYESIKVVELNVAI